MAQNEIINKIKKYLILLNSKGVTIDHAFLYGSFARNEEDSESDIDVMLISDLFEIRNDDITYQVWKSAMEIDKRMEPYLVSTKRFNKDDYSPLISSVKTEGIEIKA